MNEQVNAVDLRAVALDIVTEVLENGGFLNRLLRQVLDKYAYLDRRDRAFLSRLCIGTVERKITLDACIDHISSLPVRKMKPFIRNLLRISAYQIYEMNGVRDYTICDEAVKIAKKRKFTQLTGFVNGILRSLIRERDLITEAGAPKPGEPKTASAFYRKLLPKAPDHVIYSLAKTHIVDMRAEMKSGNSSILSRTLHEMISDRLSKGEQVMLFLNRRGFSNSLSCYSCGYVEKCPKCDIALTYHQDDFLRCHYCGYMRKATHICPSCKAGRMTPMGIGTQKAMLLVQNAFPEAKILRMDQDTTAKKDAHKQILSAFANHEADILPRDHIGQ